MLSYKQVTETEAAAYAKVIASLGFKTDRQILDYIKAKAINSFNPKNLIVGIN